MTKSSSWLVSVCVAVMGCGDGIDKKGPDLADNNSSVNNANNTVGSNNTTASNNGTTAPNSGTSNNTIAPPNNVNNTIVPPNNTTNNRDWWTCFTDADGDGFGTDEQMIDAFCEDVGLVLDGGDCDDTDDEVFPGAVEACDAVDRDCDGVPITVPDVCGSIQQALDMMGVAQAAGDVVVGPGVYRENIDFKGGAVRLIGAGPENTTIDGSDNALSTVRFRGNEGPDTVLEGFTIIGGSGELTMQGRRGGGIYIDEADPTLRNLVVRDNRADGDSGYGGGISLQRSSSLLERVDVIGNRSGYYGGGIYLGLSDAELRQVRVIDNQSLYGGGLGIYYSDATIVASAVLANTGTFGGGALIQGDAPTLENVAWVGNSAEEGGAVTMYSDTTAVLTNNTMSGNRADTGGAIFLDAGTPTIRFTNFFDNGPTPLVGLNFNQTVASLQEPPGFVSTLGLPASWDLHLVADSALIDAGTTDFDDFDGSRSDIGAHGGPYGDW